MTAVDTNVVVRLLTEDHPKQTAAARSLFAAGPIWIAKTVLLETGWIRPRGRRKTPGRPLTFGTTEAFLSQFSLEVLGDLPGLEELRGTGLLDSRLPSGFSVPAPSDDPALRDDEDPLEIGDLELALAPAVEPEKDSGN